VTATADQMRQAIAAGRAAGAADRPVTACPHPPGILRTLWLRHYVHARLTRLGWPA
jgi:hypothetical protein